jgi:hypothetical protein
MSENKIYVNADFFAAWTVNGDLTGATITVEYITPTGTTLTGLAPSSVVGNRIQYNISRFLNTVAGVWKFRAKIIQNGLVTYNETVFIQVSESWT